MSSFGSNSTRKTLKNWSDSNGGLPRRSAGAGKKFCNEVRQAVEQVTQEGFTISALGGFQDPTGQSLGNWSWSQCLPGPKLDIGLRPPEVLMMNMNDALTPVWNALVRLGLQHPDPGNEHSCQIQAVDLWFMNTSFSFSFYPSPQAFPSCSLMCCKAVDELVRKRSSHHGMFTPLLIYALDMEIHTH